MVEVFKTDVLHLAKASVVLESLHIKFSDYEANFDLDDCDNILRIKSKSGIIDPIAVLELLSALGCRAEILPE
jgi:hypothetical protein